MALLRCANCTEPCPLLGAPRRHLLGMSIPHFDRIAGILVSLIRWNVSCFFNGARCGSSRHSIPRWDSQQEKRLRGQVAGGVT
jgi:hypothetical protein